MDGVVMAVKLSASAQKAVPTALPARSKLSLVCTAWSVWLCLAGDDVIDAVRAMGGLRGAKDVHSGVAAKRGSNLMILLMVQRDQF